MQPTRADGCLHHRLKLPDANQDASGAFFTHAITTPRKQRLLTAGRGTNLYVSRSAGILPAHRLASAIASKQRERLSRSAGILSAHRLASALPAPIRWWRCPCDAGPFI